MAIFPEYRIFPKKANIQHFEGDVVFLTPNHTPHRYTSTTDSFIKKLYLFIWINRSKNRKEWKKVIIAWMCISRYLSPGLKIENIFIIFFQNVFSYFLIKLSRPWIDTIFRKIQGSEIMDDISTSDNKDSFFS